VWRKETVHLLTSFSIPRPSALFDAVLRSRKLGYIIDAAHGDYRTCLQGVLGGLSIIAFQSIVLLVFQV
jgi:hypothetical protein